MQGPLHSGVPRVSTLGSTTTNCHWDLAPGLVATGEASGWTSKLARIDEACTFLQSHLSSVAEANDTQTGFTRANLQNESEVLRSMYVVGDVWHGQQDSESQADCVPVLEARRTEETQDNKRTGPCIWSLEVSGGRGGGLKEAALTAHARRPKLGHSQAAAMQASWQR
jgi:hypothetical protein